VGGLARKSRHAVHRVERYSQVNEVGYPVGGLLGQDSDRLLVAKSRPGRNGILKMQLRRVFLADSGRNAALGVAGIAVVDAALGDQQYAAMFLGQQAAIQAGNAAANYYVIKMSDGLLLSDIVSPEARDDLERKGCRISAPGFFVYPQKEGRKKRHGLKIEDKGAFR
jgi:hypothetical protein